jgi:hypothetical protein
MSESFNTGELLHKVMLAKQQHEQALAQAKQAILQIEQKQEELYAVHSRHEGAALALGNVLKQIEQAMQKPPEAPDTDVLAHSDQ